MLTRASLLAVEQLAILNARMRAREKFCIGLVLLTACGFAAALVFPIARWWFLKQPPHFQTPLLQAGGAIAAAIVALVGVTATLWWNRHKHLDDHQLGLKKEAFLRFMQGLDEDHRSDYNFYEDSKPSQIYSSAVASINLICTRDIRMAVGELLVARAYIRNSNLFRRQRMKEKNADLDRARTQYETVETSENAAAVAAAQQAVLVLQKTFWDEVHALQTDVDEKKTKVNSLFRRELRLQDDLRSGTSKGSEKWANVEVSEEGVINLKRQYPSSEG